MEVSCSKVAIDTSVLINLIHVDRLALCDQLPAFDFVIPDHVLHEITRYGQRDILDRALGANMFQLISITDPEDIAAFAELTMHLGRGEAACLVLAETKGWFIASDEKGRFRREALARVGETRILGTVKIYTAALQAGLLSVEQADKDKAVLKERRFRMPFGSFREILPDSGRGRQNGK